MEVNNVLSRYRDVRKRISKTFDVIVFSIDILISVMKKIIWEVERVSFSFLKTEFIGVIVVNKLGFRGTMEISIGKSFFKDSNNTK